MYYANKGNKQYAVHNEADKQNLLAQGFDIIDETGAIIEYSPAKTVRYSEFAKLQAENEALKAENEALKKQIKASADALDKMSVAELTAYAKEHNIDIGQATTTKGILEKIKAAQVS